MSVLSSSEGIGFSNPKPEQGCLFESGTVGNKDLLFDSAQNNIESASKQKYLREFDESKPAQNHNKESKSSQPIHGDTTSTSESPRDGGTEIISTNDVEELANNDPPQTSSGVPSLIRLSGQELRSPHLERAGVESHNNTGIGMVHSSSVASPVVSSSNIGSQSLEDDNVHEVIPSGLRFLMSDRIQGSGEGNLFHVDVMSISSSNSPGNNNTINTQEARQNSRRMFWDASFQVAVLEDNLTSQPFCLLQMMMTRRNHFAGERRWHSRSQFRERLRGGTSERGGGTSVPQDCILKAHAFAGWKVIPAAKAVCHALLCLLKPYLRLLNSRFWMNFIGNQHRLHNPCCQIPHLNQLLIHFLSSVMKDLLQLRAEKMWSSVTFFWKSTRPMIKYECSLAAMNIIWLV